MSDCATQFAPAPAVGNNFSISITAETREQCANALCAKLSDGGSVTVPLSETFWGSYFGMCTDLIGLN